MIFSAIYFSGVAASAALLWRQHKNWIRKHPDADTSKFEWGFGVIVACLSWVSVSILIFGGLASYNELDWDE